MGLKFPLVEGEAGCWFDDTFVIGRVPQFERERAPHTHTRTHARTHTHTHTGIAVTHIQIY